MDPFGMIGAAAVGLGVYVGFGWLMSKLVGKPRDNWTDGNF